MGPTPTRQRVRAVADEHGDVNLTGLDLAPGAEVEDVVVVRSASKRPPRFPLRGKPIQYIDPTDPVAHSDWAV